MCTILAIAAKSTSLNLITEKSKQKNKKSINHTGNSILAWAASEFLIRAVLVHLVGTVLFSEGRCGLVVNGGCDDCLLSVHLRKELLG